MRIDGSYSIGTYAPPRPRKRAGEESGFSVGGKASGSPRVSTHETRTLSGIESMLALQGLEEPDPREEGLKRGNAVLDILEELKVAMLEGADGGARLDRLAALVGDLPAATGNDGLDEVIAAVDLRAKVELAKRGR